MEKLSKQLACRTIHNLSIEKKLSFTVNISLISLLKYRTGDTNPTKATGTYQKYILALIECVLYEGTSGYGGWRRVL